MRGRVTQDPIFTCRKNLSTDNVSEEAKLTFIKLIIYWTQGKKFSTKMKTTKFTQMCISPVLAPHRDRRHLVPVLHLYFSAHAYPCRHANISQCLLSGRVFLQPRGAMTFSLIPIAHHNQFQPLINSLNSRAWWWAAHLELIPPYWAFHLATCKPINPNTHIYSTKSSGQMC